MRIKKKFLVMILLLIVFVVFSPFDAKAVTSLPATGDWSVEYEIDDSAVTEAGGEAIIKLYVTNTSSTTGIYYISIDLGAGTDSHFYQNDPILDLRPGLSVTLTYTVEVDASDVGKSMNFWVAMSQSGADDVDGIGVVQIIMGEAPVYDFSCSLSSGTVLVDEGDSVVITATVVNTGNRRIRVEVVDSNSELVGTSELGAGTSILFDATYTATRNRDFKFKVKAYRVLGDTFISEKYTNTVTVRVNQIDNIDFAATLSADTTQVEAGSAVNFTVAITNTGADDIMTLSVKDGEGNVVYEMGTLLAGTSVDALLSLNIYEEREISYTVSAVASGVDISKQTNAIRVRINEVITTTDQPSPSVEEIAQEELVEAATETDADTTADGINKFLLIAVGVLVVLVIIMIIMVTKLMKKESKKRDEEWF